MSVTCAIPQNSTSQRPEQVEGGKEEGRIREEGREEQSWERESERWKANWSGEFLSVIVQTQSPQVLEEATTREKG